MTDISDDTLLSADQIANYILGRDINFCLERQDQQENGFDPDVATIRLAVDRALSPVKCSQIIVADNPNIDIDSSFRVPVYKINDSFLKSCYIINPTEQEAKNFQERYKEIRFLIFPLYKFSDVKKWIEKTGYKNDSKTINTKIKDAINKQDLPDKLKATIKCWFHLQEKESLNIEEQKKHLEIFLKKECNIKDTRTINDIKRVLIRKEDQEKTNTEQNNALKKWLLLFNEYYLFEALWLLIGELPILSTEIGKYHDKYDGQNFPKPMFKDMPNDKPFTKDFVSDLVKKNKTLYYQIYYEYKDNRSYTDYEGRFIFHSGIHSKANYKKRTLFLDLEKTQNFGFCLYGEALEEYQTPFYSHVTLHHKGNKYLYQRVFPKSLYSSDLKPLLYINSDDYLDSNLESLLDIPEYEKTCREIQKKIPPNKIENSDLFKESIYPLSRVYNFGRDQGKSDNKNRPYKNQYISKSALKEITKELNLKKSFFSEDYDTSPKVPNSLALLNLTYEAWRKREKINTEKTSKESIKKFIKDKANEFDANIYEEDSERVDETLLEGMAKIANWDQKPGPPRKK